MVKVSVDELRRRLIYDSATGGLTWRIRVGTVVAGSEAGHIDRYGYRRLRINRVVLLAHRVVWALHFGKWPKDEIDHIDGNRANNHISNLRQATTAENAQNRKVHRNNTSGFPGVSRSGGMWIARIRTPGERHCLGVFETPEAAYQSYLDAKARLHVFNPTQRRVANQREAA